jgi:predicted lipoprotein with Yx(FWY)xxD motif
MLNVALRRHRLVLVAGTAGAGLLVLFATVGSNADPVAPSETAAAASTAATSRAADSSRDPEAATRPPALEVGTASAPFGSRLAAKGGMTLYVFSGDSPGRSDCVRQCAAMWPPVRSLGGKPQPGNGVKAAAVGSDQVTFNGHPLYYYSGDRGPGDTTGQGRSMYGGHWSAVPPSAASATTGGGR